MSYHHPKKKKKTTMRLEFYGKVSLLVTFTCLVANHCRKFCQVSVEIGLRVPPEVETIWNQPPQPQPIPATAHHRQQGEQQPAITKGGSSIGSSSLFECPLEPCHVSIVFVGDSLTRFQYYSLAYFLRHNNTWIDPKQFPNLAVPREYLNHGSSSRSSSNNNEALHDWEPWFHASWTALRPYESCDCYRPAGSTTQAPGKETLCENRYYHDPTRNHTLVYLQARGHMIPLRGHWKDTRTAFAIPPAHLLLSPDTTTPTTAFTAPPVGPHNQSYPYAWSYHDWSEALLHQVIQPLRPDVLVLNAGHFASHFWKDPTAALRLRNMTLTQHHIPHVIWKTTSSRRHGRYPPKIQRLDQFMCRTLPQCLDVTSWTRTLDSRYYVDDVHFREPIYRRMNELLLQHVGIAIPGIVSSQNNNNNNNINTTTIPPPPPRIE